MKKISVICHDLSNNALGRAYIIAKMLQSRYKVEIVGPSFSESGEKIWAPVSTDSSVPIKLLGNRYSDLGNNLKAIDGDIIYAIKPKPTSYGYALIKKAVTRKKVILDEDDWDENLFSGIPLSTYLKSSLDVFYYNNPIAIKLLSRAHVLADAVTVSSPFLQRLFGGVVIPHARDAEKFNVDPKKTTYLRQKLNLAGKKVIVFMGTVRRHKGIDMLVGSVEQLGRGDVVLLVVGVDKDSQALIPNKPFVKIVGPRPFKEIPDYVSLADVVVLPQLKTAFAQGQTPAKLFDAMALGKPIIASAVGSVPYFLEGCGVTYDPDKTSELTQKIRRILDHPELARTLGYKAKRKFLENYTTEIVGKKLIEILERLEP